MYTDGWYMTMDMSILWVSGEKRVSDQICLGATKWKSYDVFPPAGAGRFGGVVKVQFKPDGDGSSYISIVISSDASNALP